MSKLTTGLTVIEAGVFRQTIYNLDVVLFGLMEIYGLSTNGFPNLNDLAAQMGKLHDIVNNDSNYFGSFGSGYIDTRFSKDLKLYRMDEKKRNQAIMRELGIGVYYQTSVYDETLKR